MWNGFIGKQIDRCDRNIFWVNLGLILVPFVIGWSNVRYWNNFVSGPTPIDAQALSRITNVDNFEHYFVTVQGRKTIDTGAEQITRTTHNGVVTHEEVSAKYVALFMDNKLLLVSADVANTQKTSFTGVLASIPNEIKLNLVDMSEKNPKLKDAFLPVLLVENNGFYQWGILSLCVGVPAVLLGLWNVQKVIRRRGHYTNHPIAKVFAAKGDATAIAAQIEHEILAGQTKKVSNELNSAVVTPSWLLISRWFGVKALPLDSLVWIYQKVTTRSGAFAVSKSFTVVICDRKGQVIEIDGSEQAVKEFLQAMNTFAPWLIFGYSDEIKKLWSGAQRSELIKLVDLQRTNIPE